MRAGSPVLLTALVTAAGCASPTTTETGYIWVERGTDDPAGPVQLGRLSGDGERLYAGPPQGGPWVGEPDGEDWQPIGDQHQGGVTWMEVLRGETGCDPDTLFTIGESGFFRSTDGAHTWEEVEGLDAPYSVRRLLKMSDGSGRLFLVSGQAGADAVLRSEDRGATWEPVFDLEGFYGDLWSPREGSGDLYLAGPHSVMYRSTDGGDTWDALGSFDDRERRVSLVGSEAGSPRLWVVIDSNGPLLRRSDDGGESFEDLGTLTDLSGAGIAASIDDPDLLAYSGETLHVSRDGGERFSSLSEASEYYDSPATRLHGDIQQIVVQRDADGAEVWHLGTGGGLYRSQDGLNTVENLSLSGLRVGAYYATLTSAADPTRVAAGSSGQGYQLTEEVDEISDLLQLEQVKSGGYVQLTSSDGTHDLVYTSPEESESSGDLLVQVGEEDPSFFTLKYPTGARLLTTSPILVADPDEPTVFYYLANQLYRYKVDPSAETATHAIWSDDSLPTSSDSRLQMLAFSPLDSARVYATSDSRGFFRSDNHGQTWEALSTIPLPGPRGHAILIFSEDDEVVIVAGSDEALRAIFLSTDGGETFETWSQGLEDDTVYCLCEAGDGSGRIFAGAPTGVFERRLEDPMWWNVSRGRAPVIPYRGCETLKDENTIRFSTLGRGIWDLKLSAETAAETGADSGPGGSGSLEPGADSGDCGEDSGLWRETGASPDSAEEPAVRSGKAEGGCSYAGDAGRSGLALVGMALGLLALRRRIGIGPY